MLTSLSTSTGTSRCCLHPPGHVEAIPPRHDRRVDRLTRGVLDGSGHADADGGEIVRRRGRSCRAAPCAVLDDPGEHGHGAERDVERLAVLDDDRSGEVGDRDASRAMRRCRRRARGGRCGLIANCDGGRPPVETVSATGMMRPMRISSSTRVAIVDRARPVDFASSRACAGRRRGEAGTAAHTPDAAAAASTSFSPHSIIGRPSGGCPVTLDGMPRPRVAATCDSSVADAAIHHVARPVGLAKRCCSSTATTMMTPFTTACTDEVRLFCTNTFVSVAKISTPKHGAGDRATPADEERAADDDRGDRVELVQLPVRRGAGRGAPEDHDRARCRRRGPTIA